MIRFDLEHDTLRLGIVRAGFVKPGPGSEALLDELSRSEAAARDGTLASDETRGAIRDVLRKGGYKPTGRGKPASEFLRGAATGAGLPRINNLVDVLNLVSLRHGHPISLFDADKLEPPLAIRFGREGESYVFNASGQTMDIAGLPVVCDGQAQRAVGNAVKDSMHAKVHDQTRAVLAVVYGSSLLPDEQLTACCDELSAKLAVHASARELELMILSVR